MSRTSATAPQHLQSPPVAASGELVRKPYEKPVLERLGSVRELTLGCTGGNLEGGKKRRPVPGCP